MDIHKVAEAIYDAHRRSTENGRWWADWSVLGDDPWRKTYRRMAHAAVDSLHITNQGAAPGDRWECPGCSTVWVAVEVGPLDIGWVRL
jgi:hypothetical protein